MKVHRIEGFVPVTAESLASVGPSTGTASLDAMLFVNGFASWAEVAEDLIRELGLND